MISVICADGSIDYKESESVTDLNNCIPPKNGIRYFRSRFQPAHNPGNQYGNYWKIIALGFTEFDVDNVAQIAINNSANSLFIRINNGNWTQV